MSTELIDVLDENGIFTGEILSRDEVHRRGLWHRCIAVAIINEKNEILLQQRRHISSGQDALSAAAREINEEVSVLLGYRTEIKDFRYMYCYRKEEKFRDDFIERQFYDFFILRTSGVDDEVLHFQKEEVQAVKFVDLLTIEKMRESKEIVERPEIYTVLTNFLFRF